MTNMLEEINRTITVLKKGGVILYPTDTVWGLGCDATNEKAVEKIYQIKERNQSKSMIVLVNGDAMLNKYIKDVPELAWDIIDLATRPTTIIYPNAKLIAKNAIAEDNSIAIRMISEGFCNQLISKFNKPIISTSANISNSPTPINFDDISNQIKNNVDYIVNKQFDDGNRKPSSIIKLDINNTVKIIRK